MARNDGEFPREESLNDLVGGLPYSAGVRWRLFKDIDGLADGGTNVLVILDQGWTVVSAADFKYAAQRILAQL